MEQPPVPILPQHLRSARQSYGAVADTSVPIYEMLHLPFQANLNEIEEALRLAQHWWNAQQANPKYRRKAGEALARLREAKEILLDPIRRQEYDRQLQQYRQSHRARHWQPIRDLIDVLIEKDECTHEQHMLLARFATRRGLSEEELSSLLAEEFLKRNVTLMPPPVAPLPTKENARPPIRLAYRSIIVLMFGALVGILILPFEHFSRSSALFAFPFFNNIRLLVRALIPSPTTLPQTSNNGWDWLLGLTILGGTTIAALFELQHSSLLSLGIGVTGLIWFSWLWLSLLWQHPQT